MSDERDEIDRLKVENALLRARLGEPAPASAAPFLAPPKKPNGCLVAAAVAGGLLFLLLLLGMCVGGGAKTGGAPAAKTTVAAPKGAAAGARPEGSDSKAAAAEAAKAEPSAWTYDESEDPMGGKTRTACVLSSDQISLSFPYHPQHMQLCIRKSPKFGLDAYASLVDDGQILCSSYSSCHIRLRFDDKPAQSWSGADAADGSSNIVFLRRTSDLVARLKTAKRLRLELEFYQAGQQSVEFDVRGLKW